MPPLSALFLLPALLCGCALLAHGLAHRLDDPRPRSGGLARRNAAGRDAGMSTAEYAVGTVAAVAFAGVLYAVVSSSATQEMIMSVVRRALTLPF
ncbi:MULTISPECIES: DUF4244 domain-containing protein [Pseudofrankia]|uniref:DUF4244 domain-containing protein n=1 Tax=Pseudofrankia TaxID=2994363 RepID=UPI000234CE67|nr:MULTISPECIES: DUF4244 domain-containing protein [Pseudofrankia]OHV32980.1 hypothetical protein BCD49_28040 [Pseudofrankia sp. EUN1h]